MARSWTWTGTIEWLPQHSSFDNFRYSSVGNLTYYFFGNVRCDRDAWLDDLNGAPNFLRHASHFSLKL